MFNFNVVVSGTQYWTDSGFNLQAGDHISTSASGLVGVAGSDVQGKNADGAGAGSSCAPAGAPMPGGPCWALVGRIGGGSPFFVGLNFSATVNSGGRLYLGVNDDPVSDNWGAWSVNVTVTR